MTPRSLCVAFVIACVSPAIVRAQQQQPPPLPDAVRTWMTDGWEGRFRGMVATGDSIFNNGSCTKCHGQGGTGGRFGPNLMDTVWVQSKGDLDGIFETIFWGVRKREMKDTTRPFEMNPEGGMNLTWDQVRAVAAYVWQRSRH